MAVAAAAEAAAAAAAAAEAAHQEAEHFNLREVKHARPPLGMPPVRPIEKVTSARAVEMIEAVGDVGRSVRVDELEEHTQAEAVGVVHKLCKGGTRARGQRHGDRSTGTEARGQKHGDRGTRQRMRAYHECGVLRP